jgi:hypothetical protein
MTFDSTRVVELVREFYREWHEGDDTEFVVVPNLPKAVSVYRSTGGHERRWKSLVWQRAQNGERLERSDYMRAPDVHQMVFDRVIRGLWHPGNKPISAQRLGRYAPAGAIEEACRHGLGWLLAVRGAALIVPTPLMRFADERRRVLHDDTGEMAIEWLDGSGQYILHGTEFDKPVYDRVIGHQLSIHDIAALGNIDQRAIALRYLTFEQLVVDSGAELLDTGAKGTSLYRLPLPLRMIEDRVQGNFDYFIHMRDASYPEREFIEWVDPRVGRQRNAELCQAHAFGISLEQWLAIEQEG